MAAVSTLHVIRESVRTAWERGPALLVLFLFLGVVTGLSWIGLGQRWPELRFAAAILGAVLWCGASVIALNTLVDSGTKIELSSMYLTDYKGIVWTTSTLILGSVLITVLLAVSSALFWLPVSLNITEHVYTLLAGEALRLAEWYLVLVQVQSLLLTIYVGARLMVFPAYVAVESTSLREAYRKSWVDTDGHTFRLAPLVVLGAVILPTFLYSGLWTMPRIVDTATNLVASPYVIAITSVVTLVFFAAAGAVLTLSLVATAYSAVKQ